MVRVVPALNLLSGMKCLKIRAMTLATIPIDTVA